MYTFQCRCCCSATNSCLTVTPWTVACQASLSLTVSWRLLKLTSIELMIPSNHLILCCPLLLLPSTFPSLSVFSNDLALCIRWPKYWSFSVSSSNAYWGLISFRIDWFDLLAAQGTLKSLLQRHNSKVSILWLLALFMVQAYLGIGELEEMFMFQVSWSSPRRRVGI